jgi:hypothetical protein
MRDTSGKWLQVGSGRSKLTFPSRRRIEAGRLASQLAHWTVLQSAAALWSDCGYLSGKWK